MKSKTGPFRVLEIGSGNTPDPRADILLDRYPWDNRERTRREPIRNDSRPLIAADGIALPFADKTFDLVMAIGVLEHTEDPARFLDEMARVGQRGLINVPTTFAERILYRPFHKYTFTREGDTLVIRRKNFPDVFGGLFDYLAHFDPDFTKFMDHNRSLFNLAYEWEGQPSYRLESYDPLCPTLAPFNRTYQGRPFEFRLCTSELDDKQVTGLLAKKSPRSWRHRVKNFTKAEWWLPGRVES